MKRKSIALFCALTLVLGGCSPLAKETANTPATEHTSEKPATTETESPTTEVLDSEVSVDTTSDIQISFELVSKTYASNDGTTDLLYTEYQKPTIAISGNETATNEITDFFANMEKEFYQYADEMLSSAKDHIADDPDNFTTYFADSGFEKQRCDSQVISLERCSSDYCGGAHGSYAYCGLNFDTNTGKLLTLSDITTNKNTLLKEAKDYIMTQLELPHYAESLSDTPENLSDSIDQYVLTDDTWYFTKSGITFVANNYILGPYASGAFFFHVPYQQLSTLKPEYQYTGPFELAAPVGSTSTANLDGNEDIDAIYYDCVSDWDTGEINCTFTINGTDFSEYLQNEDCQLTDGASYGYGTLYYVVDLDTSDEFCEIAILDHGPSDDPVTYFFRYNRGNLTYLGSIPDYLNNDTCHANGDGTVSANIRIALLETAKIPITYQLTDEKFELIEQDWYYIDEENFPEEYRLHNIISDVVVHTENSLSSDTVTLTPADGPVSFPATDNEHWFMIKTADEQIYYLYLEDFGTLESGQFATDIFENILLAD